MPPQSITQDDLPSAGTGTLACADERAPLYDAPPTCTPFHMPVTEVLVCSPQDLLYMFAQHAKASPAAERSIRAELAQTSFGRLWNEQISPVVNHPATLPAGLATGDAYLFARAAHALHSLPRPPGKVITPADMQAFTRILHSLGIRTALAEYKIIRGTPNIILKGYAGLRNQLRRPYYPLDHAKVVTLGIGTKGLQQVARGGAVLSIITTVGLEVVDYMLKDHKTMADLIGGIGVEVVKSGVALGAGYSLGMILMGTGTVFMAVLPLGAMIIVSVFVGSYLNSYDNHYQIKDSVIQALNNVPSNLKAGIYKLEQGVTKRLHEIHLTYEREVEKIQSRIAKTARQAVSEAISHTVELALHAARQRALETLSELISPTFRPR